jgi:hypothetical protein
MTSITCIYTSSALDVAETGFELRIRFITSPTKKVHKKNFNENPILSGNRLLKLNPIVESIPPVRAIMGLNDLVKNLFEIKINNTAPTKEAKYGYPSHALSYEKIHIDIK